MQRVFLLLGTVTFFVLLIALNAWSFPRIFQREYFEWYLTNGALIGVLTSLFAVVWGNLNRNDGLIASDPVIFLRACCQLVALPGKTLGDQTSAFVERTIKQIRFDRYWVGTFLRSVFELLAADLCLLVFVGAMAALLIVVMPLQYFVFLIAGAPARLSLKSPIRAIARLKDGVLEVDNRPKDKPVPDGWWDASYGSYPVSVTGLLAALLLLILRVAT